MHLRTLLPVVLLSLVACGKDKGGGAATGGPSCADAAAGYVRHDSESGGNRIYSLKPTADEAKEIAAKLEADCTARNWSEKIKTCLVAPGKRKLGDSCGTDINASQVVFDAVTAVEASRTAAGPAVGSGSAAAGSGDGSAK